MQLGTYVDGRALNYDEESAAFDVGGSPVALQDVLGYDQAGQVNWLSDDLKKWAQDIAGGLGTDGRPAVSPSDTPVAEVKRGKLLGFRSRRVWKMVVACAYYAFCGLAALGVFASVQPYATDTRDVAIDVVSYLLVVLLLLSPALLLSDFGYRQKLPLFKRRKLLWSVAGLALVFVLLSGTIAFAESVHSQPYKVAAEKARVALQKKQEAEAAAKRAAEERAAAEARRLANAKKAAETSAAAEAQRLANAKKAADASATAEAKRLADEQKAAAASAAAAAQKSATKPAPTTPPATQTKADYLRQVVTAELGQKTNTGDKPKIRNVENSGGDAYWLVTLNGNENLTNDMTKKGMWLETKDVWKRVFTERKDIDELIIRWYFPLVDAKGNTADARVMELVMTKKNAADVNWDNVLLENVPVIADDYWESPVFNR
jgi:cytoskeletal protein RodZ